MVTSQLDAVVTSMNVLNPMEIDDVSHSNVCCDLNIRCMLLSQTVITLPYIVTFVGSESHLLTVSYSAKTFRFAMNTAEE